MWQSPRSFVRRCQLGPLCHRFNLRHPFKCHEYTFRSVPSRRPTENTTRFPRIRGWNSAGESLFETFRNEYYASLLGERNINQNIYFAKARRKRRVKRVIKERGWWTDVEDGPIVVRRNIEFRYSLGLFVVIGCDRIINIIFFLSYVTWPRADCTGSRTISMFYCFVILFRMHANVPPKIRSIQCSEQDQRAHPDKEVLVIVKTKAAEFISTLFHSLPPSSCSCFFVSWIGSSNT